MAQVKFPLDLPLFTFTDLKQVSRLASGTADALLHRGVIGDESAKLADTKKKRRTRNQRRFSAIGIAKARFIAELLSHRLMDSTNVTSIVNNRDFIFALDAKEHWMWAIARGVESGKRLELYCYATYSVSDKKWQIDVKFRDELQKDPWPCFGLEEPHVFIPISEIFERVYVECKELLGIMTTPTDAEV